jgi:diaminohydroxyphosphoribosylaminopyrimidine deaminase/5-amino-6-(5-phosphoribosylamino)uracil reductase
MARALALAERGRGRTSPNPMVGAVVVDGEGVVVGRGAHELAGGPHAEVHALAQAGDRAKGATLYCTLEPCCHTGRTGPCAPLVAASGVRRVVVSGEDPNPLVSGRGLSHLRQRGVVVESGVLAAAAARLNAPFFTVMRHQRPFVTMKVALSRDRAVAGPGGARTALTGPAANRLIHRERAEVDAIGIGSGTLLADDPVLTARGAYRTRPLVRVVFDRSLRMRPDARILSTLDAGPIIVLSTTRQDAGARARAARLESAGARVELVAGDGSGGFLASGLAALARLGVLSLMLEGGPALHAAAWSAGLVDRVQIFNTPMTLGPDAVPWLPEAVVDLDRLFDRRAVSLGDDVMVEGYVHRAG